MNQVQTKQTGATDSKPIFGADIFQQKPDKISRNLQLLGHSVTILVNSSKSLRVICSVRIRDRQLLLRLARTVGKETRMRSGKILVGLGCLVVVASRILARTHPHSVSSKTRDQATTHLDSDSEMAIRTRLQQTAVVAASSVAILEDSNLGAETSKIQVVVALSPDLGTKTKEVLLERITIPVQPVDLLQVVEISLLIKGILAAASNNKSISVVVNQINLLEVVSTDPESEIMKSISEVNYIKILK